MDNIFDLSPAEDQMGMCPWQDRERGDFGHSEV